jgi:peptidoglycan/xylan/chitin deacetylase (PgdA/CDA1 family)
MNFHSISILFILLASFGCNRSASKEIDPEKEVTCFVYHRFGDDRYPSTNISMDDFEAHLKHLKAEGFQVLTFASAIDYLQSDDPVKKTAVLTIDDGYESFYENGLPLLQKYEFPATLYINTETVGGNSYMDWEQLKTTKEAGIEIGNHTHSHAYFLNQPAAQRYDNFEKELKKTQRLIEENLGEEPVTFAYPYGELDERMLGIVKDLGFKGAAAQNSGVIGSSTDLHKCPRFPMSEAYSSIDKFKSKAEMRHVKLIKEEPSTFIATDDQPKLSLTLDPESPLNGSINCFIQGGDCAVSKKEVNGKVILSISPEGPITGRRRFLYTFTSQQDGQWYWYSHLWIRPEIE